MESFLKFRQTGGGLGIGAKLAINFLILITFGIIYAFYFINAIDQWDTPLEEGAEYTTTEKWVNGFHHAAALHTNFFGDHYPNQILGKVLVAVNALIVFIVNLVL